MIFYYSKIRKLILCYLSAPLILFLVGFLRLPIAVLGCVVVGVALLQACGEKQEEKILILQRGTIVLLLGILLVWTWLGGLNGLFYQSDDWPWRNAIYRDLIVHEWPVIYPDKDWALVYYVGFWLPPALLSKMIAAIAGNEVAWKAGQLFLWIWAVIGLILLCLLLFHHLQANTRRQQIFVVLFLIFFSGMDLLGAMGNHSIGQLLLPDTIHLEWWSESGKQYSSLTTCLYWVFNQSVVPWLATLCFCEERNPSNYLLLGMTCFVCGPIPFVGLVVLMLVRCGAWLVQAVQTGSAVKMLCHTFSLRNIALLMTVFPVLSLYYLGNLSVVRGSRQQSVESVVTRSNFGQVFNWPLLLFLLLECGIYILLVWHSHQRDPMFYAVMMSLLFIPFFQVGYGQDFCMRASIPALFVLMTFCGRELLEHPGKSTTVVLAITLCIGAATPLVEIGRGLYHVISEKTVFLAQDSLGSIENADNASNFVTEEYEDKIFYEYLARTF